jgi:hypothetical protein
MVIEIIGKIKRVPLREVWKHEALDFTKGLEDNIDVVSEKIGIPLSNAIREKNAGDFSVDLLAKDESGNPVIIENQLEKSNHDHLGKLITYLVAVEAKAAIWIVSEPRPEHIAAISWLNESRLASFYLIQVQAIRIDDSKPAPLLTLIVGLTEESRRIGEQKKEMVERYTIREKFWTQFLTYSQTQTKLYSAISPTTSNWISITSGLRGLGYNYFITQNETYVELYIDRGKDSEEENLNIFRELSDNRQEIEKIFGEPLIWDDMPGRRACRIRKIIDGGYCNPELEWFEIHKKMAEAMIRLEKALSPFIKKLNTGH